MKKHINSQNPSKLSSQYNFRRIIYILEDSASGVQVGDLEQVLYNICL